MRHVTSRLRICSTRRFSLPRHKLVAEAERAEQVASAHPDAPAGRFIWAQEVGAQHVLGLLSPASHQVAALLLFDLDRAEIAWILGISPAALRQRIRLLRTQLARLGGLDRQHLLSVVRRHAGLATTDPDGHRLSLYQAP